MRVLTVGDIFKGMSEVNIRNHFPRSNLRIPLAILDAIPESQRKQNDNNKTKATYQNRKRKIVPRRILIAEYLGTNGITGSPEDKVASDDD